MIRKIILKLKEVNKSDIPGSIFTKFLYLSVERDMTKRSLIFAYLKLLLAVMIERIRSIIHWFLLFSIRKTAPYVESNILSLYGKNLKSEISYLYALYKKTTYFGSIEDAAKIRLKIAKKCVEMLEKKKLKLAGCFEFCSVMDILDANRIAKLLDELSTYEKKKPWYTEFKSFLESIEGSIDSTKKVNIVGPNFKNSDFKEIKSSDINVFMNKPAGFHVNVPNSLMSVDFSYHLIYVNSEFLKKNKDWVCSGSKEKAIFKIRESDKGHVKNIVNLEPSVIAGYYDRPDKFFINGRSNMVQSATYDLLKGSCNIKLIGVDLYTSEILYENEHYSASKPRNEINIIERRHDLLSNFSFLKFLHGERVLSSTGSVKIVDELTLLEYAKRVQDNLGSI